MRLNTVLPVLLILALLLVGCYDPPAYEPATGVEVHHYDVEITLNPDTRAVEGRAVLAMTYPDTLDALSLSFGQMTTDSVLVDGTTVEARHRRRRLSILLPEEGVRRDTSMITVVYRGTPSEGIYTGRYGGRDVVFADGWPERVRGWMPGSHHPRDAATLSLSLTIPIGYDVVATGYLTARDTLVDREQVRSQFSLQAPAPTYTYAFAAGDFSVTSDTAVWDGRQWPIHYHMLSSDNTRIHAIRRTPDALALFSELIGPYPFEEYASVQVPFDYAGMENAATSFLQAALFQEDTSREHGLHHAEAVAVHELAHQWFGNHLSLREWRDLWLSEGMATYLTTVFFEHADGEEVAHDLRVQVARVERPRRQWRGPLVPESKVTPQSHLSPVIYNRGASVLHLLRLVVGDDAFFGALQALYREADEALSTARFQAHLERESGTDLHAFFESWVYGTALPVLRTEWSAESGILRWYLEESDPWIEGSPVLLQVQQGEGIKYFPLQDGQAELEQNGPRPEVHPVGVMIRVR